MQSLLSRTAVIWAAVLAAGPPMVAAAAYPERPVRIIVPFSAGGASDIMGRLLAQKLSEKWGQQAYVENRPGAGGNIGMDVAARAAPDGYTIVLMNNAAASNAVLEPKPAFDVTRDFIPIALVASTPMVLVANPRVQASNLDELTDLLKRNPGKFSYGSCGAGGPQNFATELYKYRAQVYMVHVPYRGCSEAAADLLGGQIDLATLSSSVALPFVQNGRLKAIATTIGRRMPGAPDIPAFKESHVPALKDYEFDIWYGVMVPARTPDSVLAGLKAEIEGILDRPDVKQSMRGASIDELRGSGEDLERMLKADIAKSQIVVNYMGTNPK
jgi:tripartite-type tricarboxylate transporter receptor subunit TctC